MSSLPARASLATMGCEAAGTNYLSVSNTLKEVGSDGMVKTFKLPWTYRNAANVKVADTH
jgi:hypothetical protein